MRLLEDFLEACDPSLDETMCLDEAWVEVGDAYGTNLFYNNEWFDVDDLENITIFPLDDDTFSVAVDGYADYSRFKNKTFTSFEEAKRYAEYLYKRYFKQALKEDINDIGSINEKIIASCDPESVLIEVLNACGGNLPWAASDLGLTVDELKFAIKFYSLNREFDSFDN